MKSIKIEQYYSFQNHSLINGLKAALIQQFIFLLHSTMDRSNNSKKTLNDEDWPVTTPVYIRNHVQENLEFDQQQFKFYSLVIGLCSTVFVVVILIIYSILSQLHESSRIWIEQQRKLGYSLKQICKERMRIIHQMVFLASLTSIFILLITNHSIASLISALFISLFTWIILIFLQKKIIK